MQDYGSEMSTELYFEVCFDGMLIRDFMIDIPRAGKCSPRSSRIVGLKDSYTRMGHFNNGQRHFTADSTETVDGILLPAEIGIDAICGCLSASPVELGPNTALFHVKFCSSSSLERNSIA